MGQRVLITGGMGFVGQHLVNAYADRGDQVTVIDVNTKPFRDDVRFIDGDIRDKAKVSEAVKGQDLVIHNASVVTTKRNASNSIWDINVGGTRNVLDACFEHGVKRLLYMSSASVVYLKGDIANGDESMPYAFDAPALYARSKVVAELLTLEMNGKNGMMTCAIRPHVIFGPGDNRFIPAMIERAKNSKINLGIGKGDKKSDFTYVSNLVDGTMAAADRLQPDSPVCGQAYFITNGEPNSFFGITNMVLEGVGLPKIEKFIPHPVAYAMATAYEGYDTLRGGKIFKESGFSRFAVNYLCTDHYFNIAKAKRDLDYVPKVSIKEGIEKTVAALKAQGI